MPQPLSIAARGVYHLPWLGRDGELFLVAVNRYGQRILETSVMPGEDVRSVERMMYALLDREDPQPELRLVS